MKLSNSLSIKKKNLNIINKCVNMLKLLKKK